MTPKTPDAIKRHRDFASTGNGKYAKDQVYEDTMSRSELMSARGYHQLADGTWVP